MLSQNPLATHLRCSLQTGKPAEDDLINWAHHPEIDTVNDDILKKTGDGIVSFVFTCDVEGKKLEPEPMEKENAESTEQDKRRHSTPGATLTTSAPASNKRPLSAVLSSRTPGCDDRLKKPYSRTLLTKNQTTRASVFAKVEAL